MNKNLGSSRSFFIAILLLSIIGFVNLDFYLPSLPAITDFFATSNELVMLSISFYLLTYSFSQILYGPLSDRLGRKKVVLFGILLSLIGAGLCLFSSSIYALLLGRLLQGLGMGAAAAIFRPILRDVFEGDQLSRYGSILGIATSVATAASPTIGGYIQEYIGWRGNFIFLFFYTLLTVVLIGRWLPETNSNLNRDAIRPGVFVRNYLHLLTNPIFMGYTCCTSLAFGGLAAYLTVSPFLFQKVIGLSPIQYGLLSFTLAGGMILGGFINSRIIKKVGRHRMLVAGVGLLFISSLTLLLFGLFGIINTYVIILPMAFYVMGGGFTFANSFAGAFTPFAKIAGFAGGLYGCIQMAGGSLMTAIMAKLPNQNQIPLGIFLVSIAVAAYFSQMLAFRYYVRHHPHP